MKIVYLFNSSLPSYNANSLQVSHMCNEIAKKNDVYLIKPNTGLKKTFFNHYGLIKNFKIINIKYFNKFPIGINFYLFSIVSVIISLKYKANLYITRNYFTALLLTILNKKIIFEVHTDVMYEGKFIKFLLKNFLFLNSDRIIKLVFISQKLKNFYEDEYKIKNKSSIILPSASNSKKRKLFRKKNILNIGYFGLLNSSRGCELLLNLSRINRDDNFYIYGGDKNFIRDLKKKTSNKNLFLNSYLSYKDVKKIIYNMDILLMPYDLNNVTSAGNFGNIANFTSPLKMFDYLSSGKVILSSDLPVLNEILKQNKNCIFIKNLNPYTWKNEILKIKNNYQKNLIISENNYLLSKKYTYTQRVNAMFANI